MATFRGSVQGHSGAASRLGSKHITAHIDGWRVGISVYGYRDEKTGKVEFHIYKTSGSNGGESPKLIKIIKEK